RRPSPRAARAPRPRPAPPPRAPEARAARAPERRHRDPCALDATKLSLAIEIALSGCKSDVLGLGRRRGFVRRVWQGVRGRPSIVVGLVAVAALTTTVTTALLPGGSTPTLRAPFGAGRAAPNGPATLPRLAAVAARPNQRKSPIVHSKPTVLHLTKAHS